MITITELNGGKILEVEVTGKLTDDDYQKWIPEFERLTKLHGKINVLFEMTQFHGWEAKAVWDDLKLSMKHFSDIDRIAMVGENQWQHWMSVFCKPFTAAKVRYFDSADIAQARLWVGAEKTDMVGH